MHARTAALVALIAALVVGGLVSLPAQTPPSPDAETWRFDRLDRIAGRSVSLLGEPRLVDSPRGRVIEFDGVDDALMVNGHPLEGATTWTWEAVFRPDGGAREQRWFHLQEDGSENRRLFEIRVAGEEWFLDAFAFSDGREKALINRQALHPVGRWYHVAAVYDGTTFSSYVDGVKQLDFPLEIAPLKAGRTSVGVRITLVNYFKGAIHSARFTRRALAPSEFEGTPR